VGIQFVAMHLTPAGTTCSRLHETFSKLLANLLFLNEEIDPSKVRLSWCRFI